MESLSLRAYRRVLRLYTTQSQTGHRWTRWFERLIDSMVPMLAKAQRFEFPVTQTGGWWWISRWRFEALMGWYELESAHWFERTVRPGDTVLDIGGHIGLHTRRLAALTGRTGQVYAFEANPENVEVLRRNLRAKEYSNVEAIHAAISDHNGTTLLHLSPGHSNHSLNAGYTPNDGAIEVPCTTIDAFCDAHGVREVQMVKIDTEGSELRVLRGMRKTVERSPSLVLLMEFNPMALRAGGFEPHEVLGMLNEMGFDYSAILDDGTLGEIPELVGGQYTNLLCVKKAA